MKICLIGQNLTNLILASVFEEKKLNVDIYLNKKFQNIETHRTIALSSENFDYLKFLKKKTDSFLVAKPENQQELIIQSDKQSEISDVIMQRVMYPSLIKANFSKLIN